METLEHSAETAKLNLSPLQPQGESMGHCKGLADRASQSGAPAYERAGGLWQESSVCPLLPREPRGKPECQAWLRSGIFFKYVTLFPIW